MHCAALRTANRTEEFRFELLIFFSNLDPLFNSIEQAGPAYYMTIRETRYYSGPSFLTVELLRAARTGRMHVAVVGINNPTNSEREISLILL